MPSRLLALLLLLAVLPSLELAEQLEHAVTHALQGEAPDHSAHHDGQPGDEHGCTGLIHLCSCHQTLVTASALARVAMTGDSIVSSVAIRTRDLADLTSLEPPHRPPIGLSIA
ncbi:MAG: hypothetical protein AB7O24_19045 [Kofleriaceae bacterium]